jgi:RimJ/RimL family protein N-acetyltransferase
VPPQVARLETERLVLRPLEPEDLAPLAALLGDRDALEHWGDPLDLAATAAWIERNRARYAEHGLGRCAVLWRESGALVGDCGLVPTTVEDAPEIELGWIVARSHQGLGVATEAAAAWRDHAFGTLGLARIVSMVSADNLASRRVAQKLGMRAEGTAIWGGAPMVRYVLRRPLS